MKKSAVFFLLMAFAALTFDQAIIVVNFYINQSAIAATQCVNRFRPRLHCNGKCQLAQRLRQEEKKNEQNPERKMESKNEIVSAASFFASAPAPLATICSGYIFFSDTRTVDRSFTIFHPPSARA